MDPHNPSKYHLRRGDGGGRRRDRGQSGKMQQTRQLQLHYLSTACHQENTVLGPPPETLKGPVPVRGLGLKRHEFLVKGRLPVYLYKLPN